jgi:RNA polymerase sigma factor (sigma-70 family)
LQVAGLGDLEALYERRWPAFVRLARAILGDGDRAADAVQDAFLACVRSRSSFRGDGPLEAWVARAVINAARKSLRRPGAAVGVADVDVWEPESVSVELAPLIAALPERQRLMIFLRYYADFDYRTIAETLGVEVGTVSATLAAAHAAVRRALEEVAVHERG